MAAPGKEVSAGAIRACPCRSTPYAHAMNEPRLPWADRHLWQIQPVRDVCLLVGVVLLLMLGYLLRPVTVPLLIALGLAYLFEPVIGRLTCLHRWVTRTRVVVATLGLLAAAMVLALALLVPFVLAQATNLLDNTATYATRVREMSQNDWVPEPVRRSVEMISAPLMAEPETDGAAGAATPDPEPETGVDEARIREIVAEMQAARQPGESTPDAVRMLGAGGRKLLSTAGYLLGRTVDLGFSLFLIAFFFFFFSTTFPGIRDFCLSCLPDAHRDRNLELLGKMNRAISGFVRGRLTIAVILAMIYAVGWSLCGVPSGALLGLATGVACLIPYLSGLGLPIAWVLLLVHVYGSGAESLYVSADGNIAWHWLLILPGIPWLVAQLADDYLLSPVIQGRATNLGPVAIVVAVIGGGVLAGLYGMLLAIPVAACIRIVILDVVKPRLREWLAGRRRDPLPVD